MSGTPSKAPARAALSASSGMNCTRIPFTPHQESITTGGPFACSTPATGAFQVHDLCLAPFDPEQPQYRTDVRLSPDSRKHERQNLTLNCEDRDA